MGWLGSGLAGLIGGYDQGRDAKWDREQQRQQLALQQQQTASDSDYRRQQLAADAADRAQRQANVDRDNARNTRLDTIAARAQGLTVAGDPLPPLPFTGAAGAPLPKNGGDLFRSTLAEAEKEDARAEQLQAAGRTDEARLAHEHAQDLRLQAQTYATGTVGLQGTLPEKRAHVGLIQAQAAAERDLPLRARQIAQGHDQASISRAATAAQAAWNRAELSAQTRTALGNLSAQTRMGVAQLTGAYMLTGRSADEATRTAIAEYNGAVRRYLQVTKPYSAGDVVPADDGSAFPTMAPTTNLNVNLTSPGSTFPPINTGKVVMTPNGPVYQIPVGEAPVVNNNANPNPNVTNNGNTHSSNNNASNSNKKVDVANLPGLVSGARKRGVSDAQIRASAIHDGYPRAAVDAALGPPKVLPVGHYQRGAFIPGP